MNSENTFDPATSVEVPSPFPRHDGPLVATEKTVQELEFPKILEQAARHAQSEIGRRWILDLRPRADRASIETDFRLLEEIRLLLADPADFGFHTPLTRDFCRLVAKPGLVLPEESLVALSTTYETVRKARRRLTVRGFKDSHPRLAAAIDALPYHEELHDALKAVFTADGLMKDQASPLLASLREEQREYVRKIETSLERILRDDNKRAALAEDFFTVLNDRYVILLKSDYKGKIPGIVQGESGTGMSIYVEPLSIVELNNARIEAKVEEAREIRRILRELSEHARRLAVDYPVLLEGLAWLDSVRARALYADQIRAVVPELTDDLIFHVPAARHPLLGEKVVPVELTVPPDIRVLTISGVNSGGKTVAVKLAGLLASMAQSGLAIPAAQNCRMPLFDTIACEIGDQQSISENLSSFSSHVTHVREILGRLKGNCLLIFDEFMSGTDPDEGAALAEAILHHLAGRSCLTFVTTHYGKLKLLPEKYPNFMNIAVEFDWERLAPTYRLTPGRPGSSLGIEMALRFGLDRGLADEARQLVDTSQDAVNRLVKDLEEEMTRLRAQREEEAERSNRARMAEEQLRKELEALKEKSRNEVRELKESFADELEAIKQEVHKSVHGQPDTHLPGRLHERVMAVRASAAPPPTPSKDLPEVGDHVHLPGAKDKGVIMEIAGRKARVLINGILITSELSSLTLARGGGTAPRPAASRPAGVASYKLDSEAVGMELNLIAMRVHDALERLEEYLDQAYARNHKEVRIVHGKGTGALRRAVVDYLRGDPRVGKYRSGEIGEGDSGVTVVTLK